MEFFGVSWTTNLISGDGKKSERVYADTLTMTPHTPAFCVQCYFIVRVQNMNDEEHTSIRLVVSQEDEAGAGFTSLMVIGKPATVKIYKS